MINQGDRIVITANKSFYQDCTFTVLIVYNDGSVLVEHEYVSFTKDEFVLEKIYKTKLYQALF